MQITVLDQPLDGHQFAAVCLRSEHGARLHGLAIQYNGAGAAVAGVAADVSTRQSQYFTNEVDQQKPGLHFPLSLAAIHFDTNQLFLSHTLSTESELYLLARSAARVRARAASSFTRPFLYSAGPRKSELGCASSAASWAVCRTVA